MANTRLRETASVKLNGSGAGTAQVGPLSAREVWNVETVSVKVSTATLEAVCRVYVGDTAFDGTFRDLTYTGSSGDVSDSVAGEVHMGHKVIAVWSGGDANAVAYMTVVGSRDVT